MSLIHSPSPRKLTRSQALACLAVCALAYCLFFTAYQSARHAAFETGLDLVSIEQPLWNTLHGRFMRATYYPVTGAPVTEFTSRAEFLFADHFQPSLLLLLPIYALHQAPETLFLVQNLALALGVFPLHSLASRRLPAAPALALAIAYLFLPAVQTNSAWDLHAANFLPPLLLAALDAAERGNRRAWWLWTLIAMGLREDLPLLLGWAMFWIAPRSVRRQATAMLVLGAVASLAAMFVLIPAFGGSSSYQARLFPQEVAASPGGLIDVLIDPTFWLHGGIGLILYLVRLSLPVIFFNLAAPRPLLAALPVIVLNGVSYYPHAQFPALFHYSAPIVPWLFVGAADGIARFAQRLARWRPRFQWAGVATAALVSSVAMSQALTGYTPLAVNFRWPIPDARAGAIRRLFSRIPPEASISAAPALAAPLSRRPLLRFFPDSRDAEWMLLDVWFGHYPYYFSSQDTYTAMRSILLDPNWVVEDGGNGLLLFRRGQPAIRAPEQVQSAFHPSDLFSLQPSSALFANGSAQVELTGAAYQTVRDQLLFLCSDWRIPASLPSGAAPLVPWLEVTHGAVTIRSAPLDSAQIYPPLFASPGLWRDCSLVPLRADSVALTGRLQVFDADGQPMLLQTSSELPPGASATSDSVTIFWNP